MSDSPEDVSGVYQRPFAEQIAFFRRKLGNLVPTQAWDDILAAEHDSAFMVAGATKADLLTDLAAAVDKAMSEGRGIEEFRRDFRAIVRKNGWTGWTGEGSVKGEAWRVRTILRTNAYTSYAAGRYAQLKARRFKYWVYRHGGSVEPRPQHLDWDGLILPADHPFWDIFYPPSDWGCSCYVVGANSIAAAKRMGGDPSKKLQPDWDRIDPKTGVPVGAGRGWNYAPGASVADEVAAMARKVGSWDYQIAKAFMGDLSPVQSDALGEAYRALPSTVDDARRYAARAFEPKPDLPPLPPVRTLGRLRSDQYDSLGKALGRDIDGFDFTFDQDAINHVITRHTNPLIEWKDGQRAVEASDFARLPQIAGEPLVLLDKLSDLGEQIAEQRLTIGNDTYIVRWAVRGKRRRMLALKTMFVKVKSRGPRPTS